MAVDNSQSAQNSRVSRETNQRVKSRIPKARRMTLSVTKIDAWSVAKVSFLLSLAFAFIQVIAVSLLWILLDGVGVFNNLSSIVSSAGLDSSSANIPSMFSFGHVIGLVIIFSIFEMVLIMVLSTVGTLLYNVVSGLVGGVHVTLGDD